MDLTQILVFSLLGCLYVLFLPSRWRGWGLFIGSVVAIYWLQPTIPGIPQLDFALPTAILVLSVFGWHITRPDNDTLSSENRLTLIILIGLVLLLSATRYLPADFRLTTRPPDTWFVALMLAIVGLLLWGIGKLVASRQRGIALVIVGMILIFVWMKAEPLAEMLSAFFRGQMGRDTSLASASELNWLGFSYVAFRLIHTFRDRQQGRLPQLSLREYVTYIIFFPAFTAGPIDRAERFIDYFRTLPEMVGLDANRITIALTRISIGLGKKFVLADSLALISLDATNAFQAQTAPDLWLLLYAYAFRLYWDFSGYSDIAIGIGILFGIQLPENFNNPYLKNNIASFWQSWHMTLSNWVRFYVFSPLSRHLLRRKPKPSNAIILFSSHMTTMIVIALWHGITGAFLIWGIWHGLGLFIHKQWTDRTRKWYIALKDTPRKQQTWSIIGILLTFHFVVIGWVWFALGDLDVAVQTFLRLFGIGF